MPEVTTYNSLALYRNIDPTHTLALRNAFVVNMRKRFIALIRVIQKSVVDEDCFGLRQGVNNYQAESTGSRAFANQDIQNKIALFLLWLEDQINKEILDNKDVQEGLYGAGAFWMNRFLFDAYKRGVSRAQQELTKIGVSIPSNELGGLEAVLSLPAHINQIGIVYSRAFTDLKGITSEMSTLIGRVLAQSFTNGDGPALISRKLVAAINGTGIGDLGLTDTLGRYISPIRRAEMLARTEIVRAHHLAMIQEYKNWEVFNVFVKAEWMTAEDDRVCTKCASLQGKIFTLEEIMNLIPYHPNCRCVALPIIINN